MKGAQKALGGGGEGGVGIKNLLLHQRVRAFHQPWLRPAPGGENRDGAGSRVRWPWRAVGTRVTSLWRQQTQLSLPQSSLTHPQL